MDEWFKARLIWLDGIDELSDAEAGRFAKALWRYAATGEKVTTSGGERFALATCIATLRHDAEGRLKLSETRSKAGSQGGRPKSSKAKESKKSFCFSEKAKESKKSICDNKNKIKDIIPLPPSTGDDDEDENFFLTQQMHNEVFDEAVRAGFKDCQATFDALVGLISESSCENVLKGIHECVEHNASSLAYLRRVLEGKPKPKEDSGDWMESLRRRGIGG